MDDDYEDYEASVYNGDDLDGVSTIDEYDEEFDLDDDLEILPDDDPADFYDDADIGYIP